MTTHRRLSATVGAATLLALGAIAPVGAQDQDLATEGRFLAPFAEPGNDAVPLGVVELEGTDNTRVYDPAADTWAEFDPMEYGRWYPTLATLANGSQFVASGVEMLLKPVYRCMKRRVLFHAATSSGVAVPV